MNLLLKYKLNAVFVNCRITPEAIVIENPQPQVAKFMSYQQKVNSETQKRAISLGKTLVQELGLEPGVDTLSRWMAHYVAERIALTENVVGAEKAEAEQQCFDTILKLWEHRAVLPNGRYPFKNFEPLFKTLSRLNPDNSQTYYFDNSHFQEADSDDASKIEPDEVQSWISMALSVDAVARILIDFALKQAAYNAEDERTVAWIKKDTGISNNKYDQYSGHFLRQRLKPAF